MVILDRHFRCSIDQILFDEGLRKEVDFRFYVGLMVSFYLKVHVSVGKYLLDCRSILLVIIEHRLDKVCDFF